MRSKHDQDMIDGWREMADRNHWWERHNAQIARQAENRAANYAWMAWVALAALALVLLFVIVI